MSDKPLGAKISFCSDCGSPVTVKIPAGDNLLRYVCTACDAVLYENPKVVVGCIPVYDEKILLCKRAIEPRAGFWTVPAGFMELGETVAEAAQRETREEACAEVEIGALLAIVNLVRAGQIHVFYKAVLSTPDFAAGEESLDVKLVSFADIPWGEIAFPSIDIALKEFLEQHAAGVDRLHTETVR